MVMDRQLFHYFLIIVLSTLCGCSGKEEPDLIIISEDSIDYFNSFMDFPSSEGSKTIKFSTNRNWEINVSESNMDVEWCKVTPTSGEAGEVNLIISVDENTSYEERIARFTLQTGEITKNLCVSQKQKDILLPSTPTANVVSYKEQTFEIKLLTNAKFDVLCDSEWINYNTTKGIKESSILLSIQKNNTFEKRSGKVIIKNDSFEQIIKISQYGLPTDLSSKGTANSYIVPLNDAYFCFDASVAGNSKSYHLKGGSKANIVWDSSNKYLQGNTIDNIEYDAEKGTIIFHAGQSEGNVLISLQDNDNNIIWSWHLWLTDYNPDEKFITFSNGTILMDRYLGASSEESIGLYYQWGRKDPFTSAKYDYFRPYENPVTVEYCISHPNTFIGGSYESTNWDWNTEHTAIWTSAKSMYDPCPPGWKVMDEACLSPLSEGCFVDDNSHCFIIGEPNCTPQTKFRATGLLHSAGHIQGSSDHISMWTSSGSFYSFYQALEKSLSFYQQDMHFKDTYSGRAYGLCIRCQRE